jgi:acyl carrier protein
MTQMNFRSGRTVRNDFTDGRTVQSDSDFIVGCGLAMDCAPTALKIRTAIANLAKVEVAQIRAQDTFDHDLVHFEFWGSLDSIAVVLELEKCLGLCIPDEVAADIPNPERRPGITVAEFVKDVLHVFQQTELNKR